ncbi:HU family DNA-binding protein [Longispora urticae]
MTVEEAGLNKGELIEAMAPRLGSKAAASEALEAVLSEISAQVARGERVSLPNFGSFEKRKRAARTGRNPQTGAEIKVKATNVPAFKPGAGFKEMVAAGKVPKTKR